MEPRISLVTLGVVDLSRACAFYEALGWRASPGNGEGFSGIALAHNARSRDEVDAIFDEAIRAGAEPTNPPEETAWGGYAAYFADPDGHLWEIAWNPFFSLDANGNLALPK